MGDIGTERKHIELEPAELPARREEPVRAPEPQPQVQPA